MTNNGPPSSIAHPETEMESNDSLRDGVSVIIPVYNSQDTLTPLVERIVRVLPSEASEFEIILINDGSRDRSWEVVQQLVAAHAQVRGICMMRNFGQHNA